ncbi:MAG TPA: hypothetical protein VHK90_06240 [Thermoanaerobaculia bacterium]|nr:hypothetical protein [Thermoanaerobaculia bacterium]
MEPQLFDRLQHLTPGSEKYRRILQLFERHTLSGVMARLLTEDDPNRKQQLEEQLRELLSAPE